MWNYHNIVNQLYFNIKCKVKKKKKKKEYNFEGVSNY